MNKRYQVFVSSTFADLREERSKVIQTLMKMDCIPAGMELFPAADEEQFQFIKRVIDDCDYYLVIIGGRYGSITPDGVSYTEKEYDYALERGLKVIGLLHENPDQIPLAKSEGDPEVRKRLAAFRERVATGRLVEFWNKPDDLPTLVALNLSKTIQMSPAIGWVRSDEIASTELRAVMQIKSSCFIAVAGSHDKKSRASVIRFSGVYAIVHTIELCYKLGIKYNLVLVDGRPPNGIAERDVISLGGTISNALTAHYLKTCVPGIKIVNKDNHPRILSRRRLMHWKYCRLSDQPPSRSTQGGFSVGNRVFLCEEDKDYGFIVKLPRETTNANNTVFLIFGWSSNASAGAAYYLLRFHRKLYDTFTENKFCVAVEVPEQGLSLITENFTNVTEAAFQAHPAASPITPAL